MPKKVVNPLLPPSYTPEEYFFLTRTISNLYSKLDDPVDKFLLAFVYELKYTQDMAAESLDKSSRWVSKRMDRIKKDLLEKYNLNMR